MAEVEKMANSAINPLQAVGSVASGVLGLIGQSMQNNFAREESEKQRNWNEQMMEKQNQWSLDQWNMTNEYNSPLEQRKRLESAGLNPLFYGLDGTSANSFESAQPLGYDRAKLEQMKNPLQAGLEGMQLGKNLELVQKQIEKTAAEKNKIESETDSAKLDNEFKKQTMQARVEGENLANTLTKAQIDKIDDERKQIVENIKKTIVETDNETLKGLLIKSETKVNDAKAKEIVTLLPLQENLIKAQTDSQRASAALSFAQAAIQQGLLDAGYVELQIDEIQARIKQSESSANASDAIAWLNQWKANMRSGNVFSTDTGSEFFNTINKFMNPFVGALTTFGDIITGPIAGILK